MKRIEFLKRLGLGAVAVSVVPSLLKGEGNNCPELPPNPNLECETKPWSITQDFADKLEIGETYKYSMTIKSIKKDVIVIDNVSLKKIVIPPLEPGKYEYELNSNNYSILVGNIESE